jgi:hypothetical protein
MRSIADGVFLGVIWHIQVRSVVGLAGWDHKMILTRRADQVLRCIEVMCLVEEVVRAKSIVPLVELLRVENLVHWRLMVVPWGWNRGLGGTRRGLLILLKVCPPKHLLVVRQVRAEISSSILREKVRIWLIFAAIMIEALMEIVQKDILLASLNHRFALNSHLELRKEIEEVVKIFTRYVVGP